MISGSSSLSHRTKLCHVIHSGAIGGGPRILSDCVELAERAGFDNMVVCGKDGPLSATLQKRGVKVYTLPWTGKWSFGLSVPMLIRLLRRERVDTTLLYGQFSGFYGAIACRVSGVPAVYEAHFPSFRTDRGIGSRIRNFVAEWVSCRLADETTVVSEADRKEYVRRRLQTPAHLHFVPNGVGVRSAPPEAVDALRQRLLGDGDVLLMAAGRLEEQKGFDVLLRAMPAVLAACPGARLALVGEGPQEALLAASVTALGLSGVVSMYRFQSDFETWLQAADIVAVPSRYEPSGLIAREAMAAGKPVIAADVQGLREAVDAGVNGILVPPDDSVQWADAIVTLAIDRERRAQVGHAAREEAVRRFSLDSMWAGYASVLAAAGQKRR